MLDVLRRQAAADGLRNVQTIHAGWDDDWRAAGVGAADVAIASRSLDVRDLRAALQKLDAFAGRRVCVTLPADGLFYPQLLAHEAVGRPYAKRGDHGTAVNVLRQMGIEAEVSFLEHASASRYESPEAALESLRRVVAPADEREESGAGALRGGAPRGDGRRTTAGARGSWSRRSASAGPSSPGTSPGAPRC